MSPEQNRLVRASFDAILPLAVPIAKLFYGRLFELAPEVRPMFKQDIVVQGRKLMDMLTALIDNLDRLEEMDPVLKALGQRHVGYGVLSHHYSTVCSALVWALSVALDVEFSPELKDAWQDLLATVSTSMRKGAAELSSS